MIAFLHFANGLYLFAYLVRDILWLRILTVVAMFCMLPYYLFFTVNPQYMAIAWQALFIAVNLVQVWLLVIERRPIFLGEDELRLYREVFSSLKPREYVKLISLADWSRADEGQKVLRQGEKVACLELISKGAASVEVDGRHIAEVKPGHFIGEMGFLTQQNASATVVARIAVEFLSWPVDKLSAHLDENPEVQVKVQGILGIDLVEKLRRGSVSAAHPSKLIDLYQPD